jgi:hypothetical protein
MNGTFVMDRVSHTVVTHYYRTASDSDRMPAFNAHLVVTLFCGPDSVECGIRSLPLPVP